MYFDFGDYRPDTPTLTAPMTLQDDIPGPADEITAGDLAAAVAVLAAAGIPVDVGRAVTLGIGLAGLTGLVQVALDALLGEPDHLDAADADDRTKASHHHPQPRQEDGR